MLRFRVLFGRGLLRKMVDAGLKGRKRGQEFYSSPRGDLTSNSSHVWTHITSKIQSDRSW